MASCTARGVKNSTSAISRAPAPSAVIWAIRRSVRASAPVFVYASPAYDPGSAPPWYQPWVWVGGRWIYYPYRYAYWVGPAYPRGRWVGRPWAVHHRL